MSAKMIFPGLCGVISLLFLACPFYIPEEVQIKTDPVIYMPLGTPGSLMDLSINDFTKVKPVLSVKSSADSEKIALYDFQGEYGDTRAYIIRIKLEDIDLGAVLDNLPLSPSVTPSDIEIDFAEAGISPATGVQSGFELKDILNVLGKYRGLEFRSVPTYFYIQGPDRIFENANVTAGVKALPDIDLLPPRQPVNPCALPVFPDSQDNPMTGALSLKPKTWFDLKDILNQDNPPEKLDFEYEINIGNITVKYDDLPAIKEEFKKPLSATLVLVLPFQFRASEEVSILSEKNTDSDTKAIHILDEGKALFGRGSADESESSMKELVDRMQSLVIQINVENNLGLTGYAPVYSMRPDPEEPEENLLGRIELSGSSSVAIPKSKTVYPFNIWVEVYLKKGQEFDIKRPAEDPSVLPLKLSLAAIVKTRINETF
jgi:hypothetical protein